ncbi:MAG: D-aminoacyl-tRNA deacylase [Thermosphaera sp.]
MYGLVYSVNDPAGLGIARILKQYLSLEKGSVCRNAEECFIGSNLVLAGFKEDVIYFDFLDERMPNDVSIYIVLSRHSSEAGVKSYTVHHTGNFGYEALYGGRPRELGVSSPKTSWLLLRQLYKNREFFKRLDYEVSYEATHHGPTSVSKPIVFIEIGSTAQEWNEILNHQVVASSIKSFLLETNAHECEPYIGVGGGHYPRKHTEIALRDKICFGHIIPKYALQYLSLEILDQMIGRSDCELRGVVVEKKGTRAEHRALVEEFGKARGLKLVYV